MKREDLFRFVGESYGTEPEYPWVELPGYAVLRHELGRKWYALVAEMPRRTLGLPGEGTVDMMNIKLDPALIMILLEQPGFLPAYHMNKKHWITLLLDGSVPDKMIKELVGMSWDLTRKKIKEKKS